MTDKEFKLFRESDFLNGKHKYSCELNTLERIFVADKANRILNEYIAELPAVYGCGKHFSNDENIPEEWDKVFSKKVDTHKAKLICVEEIK